MSDRPIWIPPFLRHLEAAMENMQMAVSLIPDEYHTPSVESSTAAPPSVSTSASPTQLNTPGLGPQIEVPPPQFPESWSDKSHEDEHVEKSSAAFPVNSEHHGTEGEQSELGPEPSTELPSHIVEEVASSPPAEPGIAASSVPEWTHEDIRRLCQYKDNETQRPRWAVIAEHLNRAVEDIQDKWAEIQRHRKTVSLPNVSPLKAPLPSKEKPSSSETGKKRRRKH